MVIRPNRESARGWTRCPLEARTTCLIPLNEHGSALNAFWLLGDREEGVRVAQAQAAATQAGLAPGPVGSRWHQMGD